MVALKGTAQRGRPQCYHAVLIYSVADKGRNGNINLLSVCLHAYIKQYSTEKETPTYFVPSGD